MTNDNQEILTNKDHELFLDIAKDIRKNPARYREAGNWLNEYCSEDAYWRRQETELKELQRKEKEYPVLGNIKRVEQFEEKIKERRTPAMLVHFQEARDYLLEKYQDQHFVPEEDSRQIIIITWILTDPDIKKSNVNITELEQWPWEPIDDVTKMSRGYANFLWFHGGRVYGPWMNLVRIAWSKIKGEKEHWYQTSTFKFVLIPIACTLILAIPAWFTLFRDRQSETILNSSKDIEAKPTEIEKVSAPLVLSLSSKEINMTSSGYVAILKFEPSQNQLLGEISFMAKLTDGSSSKILNFSPIGVSIDVLQKITGDGKEAQLTYTITGGYPKLKLETSNTCKVTLSGSHVTKPIILEIK